jgi:hypothetical protein
VTALRSPEQRAQALELANEVRMGRSHLKADIRAGRVSIVDVLTDPPECLGSMTVYVLLQAVPRVGPSKARSVLSREGISTTRTMGMLPVRQRLALAHRFERPSQL